jgi:hypothetical protein
MTETPQITQRFSLKADQALPDRFMVRYVHPKLGERKRWFDYKDAAIEWMDLISLIPGVHGVALSEHWKQPQCKVLERRDNAERSANSLDE